MTGTGRRHTSNQLDIPILICSLVAGLVGYLISGFVYTIIKELMWSPLAVGISFMIFAIVFIIIMVVVSLLSENLGYHISKHHDGGQITLALLAIIVLSLLLGTLFEFIYEIDMFSEQDKYLEPTSYVFIIDNSGSMGGMGGNDEEGLRYSAIEQIISKKDSSFPYAVYSFGDYVNVERALAPVSSGNNEFQPEANGGTNMKLALQTVFDDYENGLKDQMGNAPKVLLLSDGYAGDIGWFSSIDKLMKSYAKNNITISTVGLGSPDDTLMQQIADATGGVYISVDDVELLEDSMANAITQNSEDRYARTLYTQRNVPKLDFVYGLMRVLFTAILGIMISCAMLFATGKGEDSELIVLSSVITGIIGGLLMELGINLLGISPAIIKILYFLLVASTYVTIKAFGGKGSGKKYTDQEEIYAGQGRLNVGESSGIGTSGGYGSSSYGNDSFGQMDDFF